MNLIIHQNLQPYKHKQKRRAPSRADTQPLSEYFSSRTRLILILWIRGYVELLQILNMSRAP